MDGNVLFALGLTLFAGLATGIGSLLAFFTSRTNTKFLSIALGFSAGVMIFVALVEIFFKAKEALVSELGEVNGYWMTLLGFFGGIVFIAMIDRLLPSLGNPHDVKSVEALDVKPTSDEHARLMKMGMFTAVAIGIHNFPEGIATFMSAMSDPSLGIAIAIAVAIHNVPEGIAVAIPIYYATGSRMRAFKLSFLSGLAEPVGAILAFLILMPFLSDILFGVIFAGVAGIMVFISLDQLLPAAKEYDQTHSSMYGLVAGMMVMGASLVLFSV